MPRDYSWSRRSIPPTMHTIGELAGLLGLGRHQARRRLKASGLPYKLYTKRWQDPNGQWYSRRAIGIPQTTAVQLLKNDLVNTLTQDWKALCRLTPSHQREFPPLLAHALYSIQLLGTGQPGDTLASLKRRDFQPTKAYYRGASALPNIGFPKNSNS